MRLRNVILLPFLLSCASVSPTVSKVDPGTASETVTKQFDFNGGVSLSLQNINGDISVSAWNQNKVEIVAHKEAKANSEEEARQILKETDIRATRSGDHISVSTHRDKWNLRGNKRLHVEYRVKVPNRTDLSLQTVNGGVDVSGVEGRVEGQSTNGNIRMEGIRGSFTAKNTNGGIRAQLVNASGNEPTKARTTNGNITVVLPDAMGAQVKARTTNGKVRTEFPVTIEGKIGKRFSGTINGGGRLLDLRTTTGGIRIQKQ